VGSTFIRALERYTRALQDGDNLLLLEGLNERGVEQLEKTDLLDLIGEENVFPGQAQFGAALKQALGTAEQWVSDRSENERSES
jgi:SulP family sulfate permease